MLSIICTILNNEDSIHETIESILRLDIDPLEIIISDAGSEDRSLSLLDFYVRRDSRIKILSATHKSLAAARNAGLQSASGDWIMFLDPNFEYIPGSFTDIQDLFRDQGLDWILSSIHFQKSYIYAWPSPVVQYQDKNYDLSTQSGKDFSYDLLTRRYADFSVLAGKIYRMAIVQKHALHFHEATDHGSDTLFNLEYLKSAKNILTLKESLTKFYHGRPNRLSDSIEKSDPDVLSQIFTATVSSAHDLGLTEAQITNVKAQSSKIYMQNLTEALLDLERNGDLFILQKSVKRVLDSKSITTHLSPKSAASKRILLLQLAIRSKNSKIIQLVTTFLLRTEDKRAVKFRLNEVNDEREFEHMQLQVASVKERARYYTLSDYEYFLDRVNPESARSVLRDKAILLHRLENSLFTDFLRREWIDLRFATVQDFADFISDKSKIVAKLFNGRWSSGLEIIPVDTQSLDTSALYENLISKQQYVVEEYLLQHNNISRLYPNALSSLRVHTLNLRGEIKIVLYSTIKLGSAGADTSNSGGIQAIFDLDTGQIITPGMLNPGLKECTLEPLLTHPDTGASFQKTKIPFSAEIRELVINAAYAVPELPFIGWDVAITPEGPAIIEGNAASVTHRSMQVLVREFIGKQGMRDDYEGILTRVRTSQDAN